MPWKGGNKVNINQRYMYIAFCSSLYVPTDLVSVFIINFPLVSLNQFDFESRKEWLTVKYF